MKTGDLRIGNYVNQISEWKVIAIKQDSVQLEDGSWHSYNFVFPIPITEDRLLKLGLIKGFDTMLPYSTSYHLKEHEDVTFLIDDLNDLYLCNTGGDGDQLQKIGEPCKYIHQVQNLIFDLIGIELPCTSQ